MKPAKVYISIPSRTKGFWSTYMHLLQAVSYAVPNGIQCLIDPHVGSSLICRARTNMTHQFLFDHPEYDFFLQLDDDVAIPQRAIVDMVNSGVDVVGGVYSLKSKKGLCAIRMLGDKKVSTKDFDGGLLEIKYLAGGCFMQHRDVVERAWNYYKKDRSYTENSIYHSNRDRVALYTPFIYKDEYLSEDYAYCQRLRDMGEKIWLHTAVKCDHWGLANYGVI